MEEMVLEATEEAMRRDHLGISTKSLMFMEGTSVEDVKDALRKAGAYMNSVIVFKLPEGAHSGWYDGMNVRWFWRPDTTEEQKLAGFEKGPEVVYRRGVKSFW